MEVSFLGRREVAPNVWEFRFQPKTAVEYVPGQYARFTFPFGVSDPHGKQHRTFTLTSHPSESELRFITRLEEPYSVYKQHLRLLKPDDTMLIDEPHGDAILPRLATTPLVFVAQGIALASYVSMLLERERSELSRSITLLWARRSEDDRLENLIPGEIPDFERVDIHYPTRLTAAEIQAKITPRCLTYLSGGQNFVESIGAELEAAGTPRERLIYDYYEGYTIL